MLTKHPDHAWDARVSPFRVVVALFACLAGPAPQYGAAFLKKKPRVLLHELTMKVFIFYRRADSQDAAARLYDHLERRLGTQAIFKDTASITIGSTFADRIRTTLQSTEVVLVIIGPTGHTYRQRSRAPRRWLDIGASDWLVHMDTWSRIRRFVRLCLRAMERRTRYAR